MSSRHSAPRLLVEAPDFSPGSTAFRLCEKCTKSSGSNAQTIGAQRRTYAQPYPWHVVELGEQSVLTTNLKL